MSRLIREEIPTTNQTNIVVGDWHYFLAHDAIAIGRSNVKTGATEYLQVPAQLVAKADGQDSKIWEKKDAISNEMKNSRGVSWLPTSAHGERALVMSQQRVLYG